MTSSPVASAVSSQFIQRLRLLSIDRDLWLRLRALVASESESESRRRLVLPRLEALAGLAESEELTSTCESASTIGARLGHRANALGSL